MVGKIEKRFGAEVWVSDTYAICVRQEREDSTDTLILRGSEVPELIGLLQRAVKEAEELAKEDLAGD